jgi:sugar/nucleoside kinase (ribokinase family)
LATQGPRTIALAAPEVGLGPRRRLLKLARAHGALGVASFVSGEVTEARDMFELADLVVLNADEAEALAGRTLDPDDPSAIAEAAGVPQLIVTAGSEGAWAFSAGRSHHRAAIPVEVASTAGAGDALLGGLLAALAAGVPLLPPDDADPGAFTCALDLGILLAALSVTSPHTIHPGADLDALLAFAERRGIAFAPPLANAL